MKTLKILMFLVFISKINAQNSTPNIQKSKTYWDITANGGFFKQTDLALAGGIGINGRFKNHIYVSANYLESTDLNFSFDIAPAFGSGGSSTVDIREFTKNLSFVAGTHYTGSFFYGALGIGFSKFKGKYTAYAPSGAFDKKVFFNAYGLEIKTQFSLITSRYLGLGLNFNYNINQVKNFHSIMLAAQFGILE